MVRHQIVQALLATEGYQPHQMVEALVVMEGGQPHQMEITLVSQVPMVET